MTAALGFVAVAISVLSFGSNFVPAKRYDPGDGVFFQWCQCIGIWLMGLFVQMFRGFPKFEPLAMLGGVLWCCGNSLACTVIYFIGMGLGLLVWGGTNLIVGWASGNFGLFGLKKEPAHIQSLNYLGVLICFASLGLFFFVRPNVDSSKSKDDPDDKPVHVVSDRMSRFPPVEHSPLLTPFSPNTNSKPLHSDAMNGHGKNTTTSAGSSAAGSSSSAAAAAMASPAWSAYEGDVIPPSPVPETTHESPFGALDNLSRAQKRFLVFGLAALSGVFYGSNFDPPQYLMDHNESEEFYGPHSSNGLDYVFSHFCGILLCSTTILVVYTIAKKNKPFVNPSIMLPGIISGLMWSMGQVSWFYANDALSLVITFPIISVMPGVVGSLWGVLWFKEIRGKRNFMWLGGAMLTSFVGVGFIAASKVG